MLDPRALVSPHDRRAIAAVRCRRHLRFGRHGFLNGFLSPQNDSSARFNVRAKFASSPPARRTEKFQRLPSSPSNSQGATTVRPRSIESHSLADFTGASTYDRLPALNHVRCPRRPGPGIKADRGERFSVLRFSVLRLFGFAALRSCGPSAQICTARSGSSSFSLRSGAVGVFFGGLLSQPPTRVAVVAENGYSPSSKKQVSQLIIPMSPNDWKM